MAQSLELNVLLKLMEATEKGGLVDTSAPATGSAKKRKRPFSAFDQDPVQQMKKIKRVEKKFEMEAKRAKLLEERKRKTAVAAAMLAGAGPTLPGKKLPIWKKRTTGPNSTSTSPTKSYVKNTPAAPKPAIDLQQVGII